MRLEQLQRRNVGISLSKLSAEPELLVQLQENLARLGLYTSRIDGSYGPQTEAALEAFCHADLNLLDQGVLGASFAQELLSRRQNSPFRTASSSLPHLPQELRGIWIPNVNHSKVLDSRVNLAQAMEFLAELRFNVVFPVVWNQGFTLYRSQVMLDHGFAFNIAPYFAHQGRDPLAELIVEAHSRGIVVIPWFEYGFASSPKRQGGHLLQKKPAWAVRDAQGSLLHKGGMTWMNALDPEVQEFMQSLILEVIQKYDVDGIQGDDRLPALPAEAGYEPSTLIRFRAEFGQAPPANPKDSAWLQWRADQLTDFLARLYSQIKAIRPQLVVSMAPSVYPWGLQNYLQDSKAWMQRGLVDLLHPQIYRSDFGKYRQEIEKLGQYLGADQLQKCVPGVAFKANGVELSCQDLLRIIQLHREHGIPGEVFFFYEGLRRQSNAVAKALKGGPYATLASVPFSLQADLA
ncbi:family 10 glycosylhydrolase [Leptolyngbya sp. FACHB-261]|uniref:family 10 glycosylhydrolase n=1 Tax=Leptolyngbya sp. FACHB-261 TaxID=2692806 RepID=UPI00168738EE|nr:family 10 glycosylhydrolase [Leptolyngbya sp. FACHB-261]MBD2100880.1 family 10 glycosylhydrolase [Leptolyngbya sp. FACHB-261]